MHSVDIAQVSDASLDLGTSLSGGLVDALNHLLLLVDPVQVVPKDSETHWLQDVGVGDDDTVGPWIRFGKKSHRDKQKNKVVGQKTSGTKATKWVRKTGMERGGRQEDSDTEVSDVTAADTTCY